MQVDCLFIHTPKFQNRYPSLGNYTSTQLMTLGIFALADLVDRSGFKSRIIHLGIETTLDPYFRIKNYLSKNPTKIVALSCQFHQQLYDSLRVAKKIKELDRDILVTIGGFSATFFAQDIINDHPYIDLIMLGDSEIPIVEVVRRVSENNRDFSSIPNLIWRKDQNIIINPERHAVTEEELNNLNYANFKLLEHWDKYVTMPKIFTRLKLPPKIRWAVSKFISGKKGKNHYAALPVGRGCTTSCAYCGGGVKAQILINKRSHAIFRKPEKVIETIEELKRLGYHGSYISFDPLPFSEQYYCELFKIIRERKIDFEIVFASWSLPSKNFIDQFKKTFPQKNSGIFISPETGSEELRKKVRGMYFSNDELLKTLDYLEVQKVKFGIFFSQGTPGETEEQFQDTVWLVNKIRKDYHYSFVDSFSIEIEPAAPWYMMPEKYGITLTRKTLADFLRDQQDPAHSSMTSLGYYPEIHRGKKISGAEEFARTVLNEKCDYICTRRQLCSITSAFCNLADKLNLSNKKDIEL